MAVRRLCCAAKSPVHDARRTWRFLGKDVVKEAVPVAAVEAVQPAVEGDQCSKVESDKMKQTNDHCTQKRKERTHQLVPGNEIKEEVFEVVPHKQVKLDIVEENVVDLIRT